MCKKEVLFAAVIGGVIGAVLVMAVGLIAPLGAQIEVKDAKFGTITCTGINIVDETGSMRITLSSRPLIRDEYGELTYMFGRDGGVVALWGKDGHEKASMSETVYGGQIYVFGKGRGSRAAIGVNEYGHGTVGTWDKNGYRLATLRGAP